MESWSLALTRARRYVTVLAFEIFHDAMKQTGNTFQQDPVKIIEQPCIDQVSNRRLLSMIASSCIHVVLQGCSAHTYTRTHARTPFCMHVFIYIVCLWDSSGKSADNAGETI